MRAEMKKGGDPGGLSFLITKKLPLSLAELATESTAQSAAPATSETLTEIGMTMRGMRCGQKKPEFDRTRHKEERASTNVTPREVRDSPRAGPALEDLLLILRKER